MNKSSFYYPLIIFIFLVNYHFYSFYKGNFFQMKQLVTKKSNLSRYESIQREHPYYEIWKLSQDNKNHIIVVMDSRGGDNIDYTTTYFKKLKGDKNIYYLSELTLFVNYFFYPRKIRTLTFYEAIMPEKKYQKDDYIISDFDFGSYYQDNYLESLKTLKYKTDKEKLFDLIFLSLYKRLKEIKISKKQYIITNRHIEKPYYIYQVIN